MKKASERMAVIHAPKRPHIGEIIGAVFEDFIELHGDRCYGDDPAICAGIATLNGQPVTVIGHRHGASTEENIRANFGMAHPEGYRKALRLAKQAEKFGRPVICLVDTAGAFCGGGAEERGQGEAIARNLYEFMALRTPVISIITGEGGSGGALALAVADRVLMLENALYSVISPRGCASILWKDASREGEAADTLRITAEDLFSFGMIEGIIPERGSIPKNIKRALESVLADLSKEENLDTLLEKRYQKFRKIGVFAENTGENGFS